MPDDASLRSDCSRCIGLCCVALAFDRGPHFAFDKAAGEACRHLTSHDGCAIHDRLRPHGFSGCADYDCRGAGQIVSAMFAGHSWRDSSSTARMMFTAFSKLREIQLMRSIVPEGSILNARLAPPGGWTIASLLLLDLHALREEVRKLKPQP